MKRVTIDPRYHDAVIFELDHFAADIAARTFTFDGYDPQNEKLREALSVREGEWEGRSGQRGPARRSTHHYRMPRPRGTAGAGKHDSVQLTVWLARAPLLPHGIVAWI